MNWSARVWSRQTHSAVSLMALTFFIRNSPSARLRREARACGPSPAQARSDLADLAEWINPVVRGWMNYYGRFSRSRLYRLLQRINTCIVRWARNKYRRLGSFKKAKRWWVGLVDREPGLFARWAWISTF